MRRLLILKHCAAVTVLVAFISACGTATYNPTAFQYHIESDKIAEQPIKTVVIAHVNRGGPSRNYLEKHTARIDAVVTGYLKENGYKVLSQRVFQQHWNTAERAFGNPVDPTTGRVNARTFAQIMVSVRDQMNKDGDLDAFIFTDLLEFKVPFSGGLKHLARWDGVTRKPSLQGPGNSVSADFDWNMLAAVASLQVSIYNMELETMFVSRGGMEATEAIDTRSSKGRYIRRRNMLENENKVLEGVQLSLHPLIPFENWPGEKD